jgi:ribosomal protein S18 acetylase RimI-like enzyme
MIDDLHLRPMTTAELPSYEAELAVKYAADLYGSTGVSKEAAEQEVALSRLGSWFPEGRIEAGQQVWVAEDADGARVGVLWLEHLEAGTPREYAFIHDFEVEESRRGEGWGRKLLALAEEQTRAWGLSVLRLNVFGNNTIARRLYQSQGFSESRITMFKNL